MANEKIGPETRARFRQAWPDMLARIADGALVKDALREYGFTDGQKRAFLATEPGARVEWDEAREASADAFLDEAMDLARSKSIQLFNQEGEIARDKHGEPLIARPDSSLVRVQVDTLKWAARVRNPKAYGEKSSITMDVRTVDLTRVIEAANARLAAARQPLTLEHEVGNAALLTHVPGVLSDLL